MQIRVFMNPTATEAIQKFVSLSKYYNYMHTLLWMFYVLSFLHRLYEYTFLQT